MIGRRSLLSLGALCTAPTLLPASGRAQTILPDKPLNIVVGFAANDGADLMARAIAPLLERRLGRRVTVENWPGNTGAAAGELLKSGPADGSTIAFMPSRTIALKVAVARLGFDPVADFVPLTVAGTFETALAVSPKAGVVTLDEYADWVKAGGPEEARLGVAASGVMLQAYGMMIGRELGLKLEGVEYRGGAPLMYDLAAGRIAAGVGGLTSLLEYHRGRKLRILAISGYTRSAVAPNVPTGRELGHPNLLVEEWYGFFASAAVPAEIADEWNRQLCAVLADPELKAKLSQLGLQVDGSTREDAAERMASHLELWKIRMTSLGLEPRD